MAKFVTKKKSGGGRVRDFFRKLTGSTQKNISSMNNNPTTSIRQQIIAQTNNINNIIGDEVKIIKLRNSIKDINNCIKKPNGYILLYGVPSGDIIKNGKPIQSGVNNIMSGYIKNHKPTINSNEKICINKIQLYINEAFATEKIFNNLKNLNGLITILEIIKHLIIYKKNELDKIVNKIITNITESTIVINRLSSDLKNNIYEGLSDALELVKDDILVNNNADAQMTPEYIKFIISTIYIKYILTEIYLLTKKHAKEVLQNCDPYNPSIIITIRKMVEFILLSHKQKLFADAIVDLFHDFIFIIINNYNELYEEPLFDNLDPKFKPNISDRTKNPTKICMLLVNDFLNNIVLAKIDTYTKIHKPTNFNIKWLYSSDDNNNNMHDKVKKLDGKTNIVKLTELLNSISNNLNEANKISCGVYKKY